MPGVKTEKTLRLPSGNIQKKRAAYSAALVHSLASGHRSPTRHETVDDHDKRDHQEQVNYSTDVDHEGTEEPKDEQDDGDRPEHACPLSEFCVPCGATNRRATRMPRSVIIRS